jgi:hypothetical protein
VKGKKKCRAQEYDEMDRKENGGISHLLSDEMRLPL